MVEQGKRQVKVQSFRKNILLCRLQRYVLLRQASCAYLQLKELHFVLEMVLVKFSRVS